MIRNLILKCQSWLTGPTCLSILVLITAAPAQTFASSLVENSEIELHVAAASDLTHAFNEITAAFEKTTHQKVLITYAASGLLEKQIENGAPLDLFASANETYLTRLQNLNLLMEPGPQKYAVGHIGIFVSRDQRRAPRRLEDLLDERFTHVAIANPKVAPYGLAAQQALEKQGIWSRIQPKLVYGENVQQALRFVESGNADAAIVSASQGQIGSGRFIKIEDTMHQPIIQALGIMKSSSNPAGARRFVDFVLGKEGRQILKKNGYSEPRNSR